MDLVDHSSLTHSDRYLMRELERPPQPPSAHAPGVARRVAIVGDGRVGNLLATALRQAGTAVAGPLGRGAEPRGVEAVLLCVPDAEISAAAALIPAGPPVGHCSGATGLDALHPHEAFSLHPLMTITSQSDPAVLHGAAAAIAGTGPATVALARGLAERLGLRPVEIAAEDRVAYHAAASIASNFLITLQAAAERLGTTVGLEREDLLPLVRATLDNWARLGPDRALTGPVARGDELTVAAQRGAVAERAPDLLPLFDALVDATRSLAAGAAVR